MRSLRTVATALLTAGLLVVPIGTAYADEAPTQPTTTTESTETPPPPAADGPTTPPVQTDPGADVPGDTSAPADTGSDGAAGSDGTDDPSGDPAKASDGGEAPLIKSLQVTPELFAAAAACDACDDSYTTAERQVLNVTAPGVFGNDAATTLEQFTGIVIVDQPSKGTVVPGFLGGFSYFPDLDATGTDTFTYRYFKILSGQSNIATVTINITGAPPQTARDDVYHVEAGTTLVVDRPGVFENDDSQTNLGFIVEDGVDHGVLNQFTSLFGGFTYTPEDGFTGTDTFTYHYVDLRSTSASSAATVRIVVHEVPTLNYDDYTTDLDVPLTIGAGEGVLANDDGGPFESLEVVSTNDVTVNELNDDGSFTITPAPGFYGYARFIYRATYGGGQVTDGAEVWIRVNDTRLPTIVDDSYTINQGETLHVAAPGPLGNDTFPSDTNWYLEDCEQPPHATVTCDYDGTLTVVPDPGFSGQLTFTYTVAKGATLSALAVDPAGAVTVTGSITVDVIAPTPATADPVDDELLPDTGSPVDPWLLALAAGMVVAGAGLVLRPRRESHS